MTPAEITKLADVIAAHEGLVPLHQVTDTVDALRAYAALLDKQAEDANADHLRTLLPKNLLPGVYWEWPDGKFIRDVDARFYGVDTTGTKRFEVPEMASKS